MSYATHNRAGEITFRQIGPLTIEATIYTYTKVLDTAVDRDSLELFWGDGTSELVVRVNGNGKGEVIAPDVRLNIYKATHTYPGRGSYTMGFEDPNRIGGILNVNWPSSVEVKFFLSSTVTLLDPQFDGTNSSVQLLQLPIDQACVGEIFVHNPNAYDPDGDSLSYELVTPMSSATEEVPNYKLPDQIGASPENTIRLDPITGEFVWESPQIEGEYNIAIKINEWRNGRIISSVTRDMQIFVAQCKNEPPTIETIEELCIIAGEKVEFDIQVNDPDEGQKVVLYASGAPFLFENNAASVVGDSVYTTPEYGAAFSWQTNCNHVSDNYYQIVLKAEDNYFGDSLGLATLKAVRIKVVAPPPANLEVISTNTAVRLTWDHPYACQDTENDFFQGFSVWRKVGSKENTLEDCETGLDKMGYTRIAFNTKDIEGDSYVFLDEEIDDEASYCYRVQADFAQISATGIPYNRIASLPSDQVCKQYRSDLPIMTMVSVINTSNTDGSIEVQWELPLAEALDTVKNPGPYTYEVYHEVDGIQELVTTYTSPYFQSNVTRAFTHKGINTVEKQHRYFVKIYTGNGEYGNSAKAASIFLTATPSDRQISLSWNEEVPWTNTVYYIYDGFTLQLIDSTAQSTYIDNNLENGTERCYYIRSKGRYNNSHVTRDLYNNSQTVCSTATDNVAPCPPTLSVSNVCDDDEQEELVNVLTYEYRTNDCVEASDLVGFAIYYAPTSGGELALIEPNTPTRAYRHRPDLDIAGCYAVAAIDSSGNIGELSNTVCVDNCPLYELPNTFTPNGDGANDRYVPITNRFISKVEFDVYNEWGNKVWSTTLPDLNWDGTTQSGQELQEGVYYYTCSIFERTVDGTDAKQNTLTGHINLIR